MEGLDTILLLDNIELVSLVFAGIFGKAAEFLGIGTSSSEQQTGGTSQTDQTTTTQQEQTGIIDQIANIFAEQTQTGSQTAESLTDILGTQISETTTLDPITQALLQGLVGQTAGTVGGGGLVDLLTQRAQQAEDAFTSSVAPIVEQARTQTEEQIGRAQTQLAGGAGSSLNTLVQQLGLEERRKGETALASLTAQLGTAARQAGTQEITGAVNTSLGQLTQIVDLLKGATTAEQAESTQEVAETQLTETVQEATSKQTTQEQQVQSLIQNLVSELSALVEQSGTVSEIGRAHV